jgi:mutator protein MutT
MARVVASVVERDGRILLCQRRHDKRHGGLWEFPGGKVEAGESDHDAVARELAEELGVTTLTVGPVEFSRPDPGSHFVIEFVAVRIEGEPVCHEHVALAWVEEARLLDRPLAPADREFAVHRLARMRSGGAGRRESGEGRA